MLAGWSPEEYGTEYLASRDSRLQVESQECAKKRTKASARPVIRSSCRARRNELNADEFKIFDMIWKHFDSKPDVGCARPAHHDHD